MGRSSPASSSPSREDCTENLGPVLASKYLPRTTGDRGSSSPTLLPFINFRSSEAGGRVQTNFEPNPAQQIHEENPVQNDFLFHSKEFPFKGGFHDKVGYSGRICTRPYSPQIQEISGLPIWGKTVLFQSPAFWSLIRPLHLLKNDAIPSQHAEEERNQNNRLLGRPDSVVPFEKRNEESFQRSRCRFFRLGLLHKLEKVSVVPQQTNDLVGITVADSTLHSIPSSKLPGKDSEVRPLSSAATDSFSETNGEDSGSLCIRGPVPPQSSPTGALAPEIPAREESSLRQTFLDAKPIEKSSRMVGERIKPKGRSANKRSTPFLFNLDRRLKLRLWRPFRWRRLHSGLMARGYGFLAHKRQRALGPVRSLGLEPSTSPRHCHLVFRQPVFRLLRPQKRILKIPSVTGNHDQNPENDGVQMPGGRTSLSPGHLQCPSGCSIQDRSNSCRVGTSDGDLPGSRQSVPGCTGDRRNGDPLQLEAQEVHLSVPPPKGEGSGLLHNRPEQMELDLPVSPNEPDFAGFEESDPFQGESALRSSVLLRSAVASRTVIPSAEPATAPETSFPRGTGGESDSPFQKILSLSRVDLMRDFYRTKFGPTIADRLVKAWRSSTCANYNRCWKEFQKFLTLRSATFIDDRLVMEFLEYLFSEKKLSPRTVLSYRSAIASPLEQILGIKVSDERFSLLARSQFLERPPNRRLVPAWDLNAVLSLLSSSDYVGSSISLEKRLYKTLFLFGLASGNRASELQALIRSGLHWRSDGSVVVPVKPGFLFKNQRANRSPPNVCIPSLPQEGPLCPVRNLRSYLEATKDHQGEALFLHPETGRNLRRPTMSLGISRLIDRACPGSLPKLHDLRKQAASLAWTGGVSPSEITAAAFWASSNVFIRHYLNPQVSVTSNCVALGHLVSPNSL